MNQDYDERVLRWFHSLTWNSIEEERGPEIVDQLRKHLDNGDDGEEFARALICHLNYVPELTHLDLWGNQIGPEGAVALAKGLRHVPNLTRLNLRWNQIGPKGAAALAKGLQHVPNLTRLDLRCNQIKLEGILYLSYVVPNEVDMCFDKVDRIHPTVLSYLLLNLSELPFYDLLNTWKKTFGPLGDKEIIRYLLAW